MRKHLSPGVVLGVIAIVLAMTGSAIAASKITGAQIKDGTITGKDVKNRSLSAAKLSDSAMQAMTGDTGPVGPAGPTGPAGPQGPTGPSVVSKMVPVKGVGSVAAGDVDIFTVSCPAGMSVVNGGYTIFLGDAWLSKTYDGRSWSIGISNFDNVIASTDNEIWAFCAPTGSAVAGIAKKRAGTASREAQIKTDLAKYRASQQRGRG
jgi:hypothetical protein